MYDGQGALGPTGMDEQAIVVGRVREENTGLTAHGVSRHAVELARIAPGSEVVSWDLETVGRVGRLTFDETGVLTGIVVRRGSRLGDSREIPCAVLGRLEDGVIYLSVRTGDLLYRSLEHAHS